MYNFFILFLYFSSSSRGPSGPPLETQGAAAPTLKTRALNHTAFTAHRQPTLYVQLILTESLLSQPGYA